MTHFMIYHPQRKKFSFNSGIVYADSLSGNQDPFVWSKNFFYSYCQLRSYLVKKLSKDDVIYFVSTKRGMRNSESLAIDLVFKVKKIITWDKATPTFEEIKNQFETEMDYTLSHHFDKWSDHFDRVFDDEFKKFNGKKYGIEVLNKTNSDYHRYTFVADCQNSFQPQQENELVKIGDLVEKNSAVQKMMHRDLNGRMFGSHPIDIQNVKNECTGNLLWQDIDKRLDEKNIRKLKSSDINKIFRENRLKFKD